ncbi:MAG: nucleotide-binding protein [Chloroflexi bacterium]|nr:nucleotide-binding protein [Chloroflexota bacterium]
MTKSPLTLAVSKGEAEAKMQARLEKGREIRNSSIDSRETLLAARAAEDKWSDYNRELLKYLFKNDDIAGEYALGYGPVWGIGNLNSDVRTFREYMDEYINRLESIFERIELIPEPQVVSPHDGSQEVAKPNGDGVFIVHGHDDAAKESAARFVEKLQLRAIILHEQPNAGRTIIEKFEACSNVGFAIVLLTPDDIGASQSAPDKLGPRARQNVVYELAYFTAKLGRGRVCALYKEGVELPSDYQGMLYIPMDAAGAWRMALAKEMKNAGFQIDLNKVF